MEEFSLFGFIIFVGIGGLFGYFLARSIDKNT